MNLGDLNGGIWIVTAYSRNTFGTFADDSSADSVAWSANSSDDASSASCKFLVDYINFYGRNGERNGEKSTHGG
jgi:hypothetical protein